MGNVYVDTLFNCWLQLGSFGTFRINASNLKVAANFRALGKQITAVGVNCDAVGSPPLLQVDLQSLSGSSPGGAILGGASPASATFTPAAGFQWVTLANAYTPALGDLIAAVCEYSSGTVGVANYADFNVRVGNHPLCEPCPMTFSGTTWSSSVNQCPMVCVQYSDGTVQPLMCGATANANIDFSSGSNPNEYGIAFAAAGNFTIDGVIVGVKPGGTFTGVVCVYDGSSNPLVGFDNTTVTAADTNGGSGFNLVHVPLTPLALVAGATYYIGWKATTANTIRVQKQVYSDINTKRACFGDASFVSRQGSGAWTQDNNSICVMSPTISAISAGGAGRLLLNLGMTGGLSA